MADEMTTAPSGPAPWDTLGQRRHLYRMGIATPVCGDDLAKDPTFAEEYPTLESYLEPPC